MPDYEIAIELEEDINVSVNIEQELNVAIEIEDDNEIDVAVSLQGDACPIIYEIDGGVSTDDSQFDHINGFLNGGGANPFM